jgi:hypothetical protein
MESVVTMACCIDIGVSGRGNTEEEKKESKNEVSHGPK